MQLNWISFFLSHKPQRWPGWLGPITTQIKLKRHAFFSVRFTHIGLFFFSCQKYLPNVTYLCLLASWAPISLPSSSLATQDAKFIMYTCQFGHDVPNTQLLAETQTGLLPCQLPSTHPSSDLSFSTLIPKPFPCKTSWGTFELFSTSIDFTPPVF